MENLVYQNTRLENRAYWLTILRWLFVVGVGLTTFATQRFIGLELPYRWIYIFTSAFILINLITYYLLNRAKGISGDNSRALKRIINFQTSGDLLVLAIIIHFAGGIENPFYLYFFFQMVIASTLVSPLDSYLQATFALFLMAITACFECIGIIPHYPLEGFIGHDLYQNKFYVLVSVIVFGTTSYLIVYLTISISSALRKQEEAYRQANIELNKKDAIKNEYVLRVTHDIKSHLAAIQTNLSVAAQLFKSSDKQKEFIDRAYSRSFRLTEFIKDLLRLTRIRLEDKFSGESFSLKDTLLKVAATLKSDATDKSIDFKTDISPEIDPFFGSAFSMEEVFTNLLSNAIKYTPKNGSVSLKAIRKGNEIHIEVTDTGIGIPEGEQEQIFDEFYRATNARKSEEEGTGMGMSIVAKILERHHGKISLKSKEGEGTTFFVTLPKKDRSIGVLL